MTQSQQIAADPAHSAWVSANAGTGKTKVLTDRVLRLLLKGVFPSKILCITYTNAAAAEMKTRIHSELAKWVVSSPDDLEASLQRLTGDQPGKDITRRARRLFATVLDAPDGIRIQTIHGLCQSLLRRFPLEAGTQPHFTVIDDRSSADMLKEAQMRLLSKSQACSDSVLARALYTLAGMVSESRFSDLLKNLISKRKQFNVLLARPGGIIRINTELWDRLGFTYATTPEELFVRHFTYSPNQEAALRKACPILLAGTVTDQKLGNALSLWLSDPQSRRQQARAYCRAILTADHAIRKNMPTKATLAALGDLVDDLMFEFRRVHDYNQHVLARDTAYYTEQLYTVMEGLQELYRALKTNRAFLDYDDLVLLTRDLLCKQGVAQWVLYKLDGGLDHLLIDEAQDTSPEQWEIVSALVDEFFSGIGARTEPRTLFVVGDQKQSIFSFQGADPTLFGKMREIFARRVEAAGEKFVRVTLERSFRSTESVLRLVDTVFEQPLARHGLTYGDEAIAHEAHRKGEAGRIEFWPLIEPEEKEDTSPWLPSEQVWMDKSPVMLARQIADTIAGWLHSGEMLKSKNRPVEAGDILILVRNRSSFAGPVIRALKQRGIPVAGADRMKIGEQLAVEDLVALGHVLLLPEDSLTLAAVLKSPLFGLSEEELYVLAYNREGRNLWQSLQHHHTNNPRFTEALERLKRWMNMTDYVSPFALFAHVLEAEGGRALFAARLGEECFDPLDEFISQAMLYERTYPPSLQGFLDWLLSADTEIKRDMEHGRNEVRVMTVHGAKGLQAPIVFMPDTSTKPLRKGALFWEESFAPVMLWSFDSDRDCAAVADLKVEQTERELEEYRRLLYVALTRAEDRLYICGWKSKNKVPEDSWYELIRPAMTSISRKQGEILVLENAQSATPKEAPAESIVPLVTPMPSTWLNPPPDEPVPTRPLAPSRMEVETPVLSPRADAEIFRRGRIIHRLLQSLPDAHKERREAAAKRFLNRHAPEWDEKTQVQIIAEVLAVLDHPDFAPVFGPGSIAEAPISGVIVMNGIKTPIAGQIDRLRVTEQDVWIIDFKTNREAPENKASIPASYRRQMDAYRKVLSAIYPGKTIHCALLFTSVPRLLTVEQNVALPLTA